MSSTPQYETYTDTNGNATQWDPNNGNKLTASLIDTLFHTVRAALNQKYGVLFYELTELRNIGNLSYSYSITYPDMPEIATLTMKKKAEMYKYYFTMKVDYRPAGVSVGSGSLGAKSGKPLADVSITLFDNGNPVVTLTGSAKLDEKTGTSLSVAGVDGTEVSENNFDKVRNNLIEAFNLAFAKALENAK